MPFLFIVGDGSALLLGGVRAESLGVGIYFVCFVRDASVEVVRVNFTLSEHLFVFGAELVDGVVVTTGQESTLGLNNAKAPSLTVMMRGIDKLFV